MSNKKIVQSTSSQVINMQTGEVVESTTSNVFQLPSEPPYVKLYLDDLCVLVNVSDSLKTLLLSLLRRLDFEGYILLSPRSRKEIAAKLAIADQTFRNRLNELCKKDLIQRVSTNEYQVNPLYFARGEWRKICMQRQAFQLRVTYSAERGRQVETSTVPQQDELPL